MTYQEAVTKLESLGVKVPIQNLDLVKQVAEIVAGLEERVSTLDHSTHGRGDESGPEDPDCGCRGSDQQAFCAASGCGFCAAAQPDPEPIVANLGFNLGDLKDGDLIVIGDPDWNVSQNEIQVVSDRLTKASGKDLTVVCLSGKVDIGVMPRPEEGGVIKVLDPDSELDDDTVTHLMEYLKKRFPGVKSFYLTGKMDVQVEPPTPAPSEEPLAKYPHCDPQVLHAPGKCRFCDLYPELQLKRMKDKINFTGESDPDKTPCPSTQRRPLDTINKWPGNRPYPAEG